MEVVILPTPRDGALVVADIVARALQRTAPVIGLATGSSPLGVYDELAARYERGELTAAHATAIVLDEYIGLPAGHPESYREVILRELVSRIDLPAARLFTPNSQAEDVTAETRRYDDLLKDLGVDVQLLGIGTDGHLGFNEPGSALRSRTRIKTLTARTRADNARFFDEDVEAVPRHVMTQGLETILDADHLVLIASGEGKAAAVAAALEGPITAMCPGSVLQMHPHATIVLDEGAASGLAHADYYRESYEHKPDWQQL